MRLSRSAERDLLLTAQRNPDAHILMAREQYHRADGALPVHRDGLQEFLHRRLFRLLIEPNLGRRKLLRTCDAWGCVQPAHYLLAPGLRRGSKRTCPNGHAYADVGVTPSGHCTICVAARHAARTGHGGQAAINAAKQHCPAGHPYSPENTYRQRTASGFRRKCRACNRLLHQQT